MNKAKRVQPTNNLHELLQAENQTPESEPTAPKPERKTQTAPSRAGKVQVCAHISKKAHRQLQILKVESEKSIEQLMIEGLNAVFTMHDKPPIA